jgi:hypothetical protein
MLILNFGARGGTRTHTSLRTLTPIHLSSTNHFSNEKLKNSTNNSTVPKLFPKLTGNGLGLPLTHGSQVWQPGILTETITLLAALGRSVPLTPEMRQILAPLYAQSVTKKGLILNATINYVSAPPKWITALSKSGSGRSRLVSGPVGGGESSVF